MRTTEIINKALAVMDSQDWYWYMTDYQYQEMKQKAYNSMRYFVELVASINDATIRSAMRELWTRTYDYMMLYAPMSQATEAEKAAYKTKKAELMAVILPSSFNMAA